ncbi:CDGSH iron-sulfur domain-containing protein [Dasania marina]|uniref:CDGSH iron-sulfur domain-containing protein n=1 Tax=Dasania marina TaxID=471499 RepID=UPI0030DBFBF9|tara:strand:- start:45596 stop:46669 length:1074 start_codon:yes stop_codon:yes gene_type:complete
MTVEIMEKAHIAKNKPFYTELKKGKRYLWCSCGLSKTQPFCDQSHVGTSFKPVLTVGQYDGEEVLFCGCKQTKNAPFCDGAHNNIDDEYSSDDPNSIENKNVPEVLANENGLAMLDGGCYVSRVASVAREEHENISVGTLISEKQGAQYQSQFYLESSQGQSSVLSFSDRHVVILVTEGKGVITISGKNFSIAPEMGIYVRPNEAFCINNTETENIKLFASVCPSAEAPQILDSMPSNFAEDHPNRTIKPDNDSRNRMADRYWEVLVDKQVGCTMATQFIGEIPESKALPHRHLYEESLVILKGSGYMWTEGRKAKVTAGDIIFLPRKQVHSLQATDPEGLYLVGVIYPGDNPSINY